MSARTQVLLTLVVSAAALLAAASPAMASVTCSNAASTLTIAHPDGIDDVTVRVTAGTITVLDDGAPLACTGPVPTTGTIGTLAYSHTGGIADVILEEPDRLLSVNVTLTETMGILSDVILRDTDGLGDSLVIGADGINFNGDGDADITGSGFATNFVFEGGAGADVFDARGGTGTGAAFGNRVTLRGGGGNDQLFGGADFDTIVGDGGNDTIDGGPDFDRLDGGPGNDAIAGGADRDEVDYSASTTPVNVDLAAAGPQNGGSLGMDTLTGVENLLGSPEGDVLRGDAADNDLLGERGDDLIEGRGGDDFLDGQGGFNTASFESSATPATVDLQLNTSQDTGSGMDTFSGGSFEGLLGSAGADTLRGTNGINRIDGGPGADNIATLGGEDTVLARDGVGDTVDCGEGTDSGTFDRRSVDSAITQLRARRLRSRARQDGAGEAERNGAAADRRRDRDPGGLRSGGVPAHGQRERQRSGGVQAPSLHQGAHQGGGRPAQGHAAAAAAGGRSEGGGGAEPRGEAVGAGARGGAGCRGQPAGALGGCAVEALERRAIRGGTGCRGAPVCRGAACRSRDFPVVVELPVPATAKSTTDASRARRCRVTGPWHR